MRIPLPAAVLFILLPLLFGTASAQDPLIEHANEPWTGDLDGMIKRGFVRILTVHNPLFFSFDGANERGMVAEWGRMFEDHLADEIGRVHSPTVVLIPTARNQLLPGLIEGRGDLVMGNLTITPERQKRVDFGPPIHTGVDELVVTGPAAKTVESFDDLVDTGLYVRRSSSYFEHLQELNTRRQARSEPPIPVTEADENLEDYDLLDMVNAGILKAVVVDSHKAAFWEQVFDKITVHHGLSLHSGGRIAWAMRKNSPQLLETVASFSESVRKGSLLGNIVSQRYLGDTEWLENAPAGEDRKRYEESIEIIKHYADRYGFDWRIIAAQAYQESRFDQSKTSTSGATGVMQLLPATAAGKAVDIPDITRLEDNIHAGVKYLHWLRETYYSDESIEPLDQILFTIAAYNAGPGNMILARSRAKRLGFSPNRWFGNVEIGMYRAVSGEPASYVRNIYKYYVTYQGLESAQQARAKALEEQAGAADSSISIWTVIVLALCVIGAIIFWRMKKFRPAPKS